MNGQQPVLHLVAASLHSRIQPSVTTMERNLDSPPLQALLPRAHRVGPPQPVLFFTRSRQNRCKGVALRPSFGVSSPDVAVPYIRFRAKDIDGHIGLYQTYDGRYTKICIIHVIWALSLLRVMHVAQCPSQVYLFVRHRHYQTRWTRSLSAHFPSRIVPRILPRDRHFVYRTSDRRAPWCSGYTVLAASVPDEPGESSNASSVSEAKDNNDQYFRFKPSEFLRPIVQLFWEFFNFLFGWITRLPAWQRQQRLRKLKLASEAAPEDPSKNAEYLRVLNETHPQEVIEKVDSGNYKTNEEVVVEYVKALVFSEKLAEYAKQEGPTDEKDHRSVKRLLKDLQVLCGGQRLESVPGGSIKTPLHISIENGLPQSPSRVSGIFSALMNYTGTIVFILVAAIWFYATMQRGMIALPTTAVSSAAKDKGQNPTVAPKQFVKEELPEKSLKTFKDVKGCPESKEELMDIVEFLKNKDRFTRMGATLPKGVLLTGPPGTGKTLLARAVAGEAGVPFYFRAGSEFEEMFVGVGSRRVRALFNAAKKSAPCIIFIDEIDAIGGSRKNWESQTRKTLNQLLVEMDGFEVNEGVIVMAATNLPETLDAALTRAGRFDRHIHVPLPDVRGRLEILEYYLKNKPMSSDVDIDKLAHQTRTFSGAELYNLVNEAALNAAKGEEAVITSALLDHARDKIIMGAERKSLVRTEENLKRTAYHESGHAVVALNTPGASPLHKATIVARGNALGMVSQTPDKDEYAVSRQQLMARIDVCMGGKVAEELVFGAEHVTTGASSDLQQATATAEHMVMHCGMSGDVGPIFVQHRSSISGEIQQKIDREVTKILKDAQTRVTKLLAEKMKDLDTLAQALLEQETLTSDEIDGLVGPKQESAQMEAREEEKETVV